MSFGAVVLDWCFECWDRSCLKLLEAAYRKFLDTVVLAIGWGATDLH
jgi:hypothetical protein